MFVKWKGVAEDAYPGVIVSTRHSYEIEYKYQYKCQNSFCGKVVGRQSKSIDTDKKVCGACMGKLVLVGEEEGGSKTPKKAQTEYQKFVKAKSGSVKEMLKAWNKGKKVKQQDVMREIGELWKVEKRNKGKEGKGKENKPQENKGDHSPKRSPKGKTKAKEGEIRKERRTEGWSEATAMVVIDSDSDEDELLGLSLKDRLKLRN